MLRYFAAQWMESL